MVWTGSDDYGKQHSIFEEASCDQAGPTLNESSSAFVRSHLTKHVDVMEHLVAAPGIVKGRAVCSKVESVKK